MTEQMTLLPKVYRVERVYQDGWGNKFTHTQVKKAQQLGTVIRGVRSGWGVVNEKGQLVEEFDLMKTAQDATDWYNEKMAKAEDEQYA